jgi:hypothetical protein
MQHLNQGEVIEYDVPMGFFDGFPELEGPMLLMVLRASESTVLRVRVIRMRLDEAWIPVPRALFQRQWVLTLESGIALPVIAHDQVLRRCDKTERELMAIMSEKWKLGYSGDDNQQ